LSEWVAECSGIRNEEEGYEADRIPALILTHNLHGVEIDDRAGALAAFALVMKAAARLGRAVWRLWNRLLRHRQTWRDGAHCETA